MSSPTPSIGRVVHVNIGTAEDGSPVLRPAMVVRHWSGTCVNVQVFLDGYNDHRHANGSIFGLDVAACDRGLAWLTSISEGEGVGSWRWPARS